MGGPENGNFPLLYVVKMSLRRWVGGSKSLKTPLRNIKMAPNPSDTLKNEVEELTQTSQMEGTNTDRNIFDNLISRSGSTQLLPLS